MTWSDMKKEAGVAEDLKLLADFVADVPIAGMQFLKSQGQGVRILVGEFGFAEAAHGGEDIQGPAALIDGNILEGFDALELRAHLIRRNGFAVGYGRNTGFGGNGAPRNDGTRPATPR